MRVAEAVEQWDNITNDVVAAYAFSHKCGAVDSGPSWWSLNRWPEVGVDILSGEVEHTGLALN